MATTTLNTRILLRGDTAANWATSTLVLLKNEMAIESDTRKIKIGDGINTFSGLQYINLTPEEIIAKQKTEIELLKAKVEFLSDLKRLEREAMWAVSKSKKKKSSK